MVLEQSSHKDWVEPKVNGINLINLVPDRAKGSDFLQHVSPVRASIAQLGFPSSNELLQQLSTEATLVRPNVRETLLPHRQSAEIPQLPSQFAPEQQDFFGKRITGISTSFLAEQEGWQKNGRASEKLASFIDQENKNTDRSIDNKLRKQIAQNINDRMNYQFRDAPVETTKDGTSFFFANTGTQDQNVLKMRTADGAERVVLDPNKFSNDGSVYLAGAIPSPDGKFIAVGTSNGSDWVDWKIVNTKTGQELPDQIHGTKSAAVSWDKDGQGFYLTRLPNKDKGAAAENDNGELIYHRLGTAATADTVAFSKPGDPKLAISGGPTEDGRYLIINTSYSTEGNGVLVKDLSHPEKAPIEIAKAVNPEKQPGAPSYTNEVIDSSGSKLYMLTNDGAPNNKLVVVDVNNPSERKSVIPESKDFELQTVVKAKNDEFVAVGLKDGAASIRVFNAAGELQREVQLPGYGSVNNVTAVKDSSEVTFSYSSPTSPNQIMKLDASTGKLETVWQPGSDMKFNKDDFITEKVNFTYTDRDGNRQEAPMYVSHRKDMKYDGNNPTKVEVYGGFDAPPNLSFSSASAEWIERGGVLVRPVLPGDGGRGYNNYELGAGENRENTYRAAESAIKQLQDSGISRPETTGITGASNGGTTVGVILNRHPELVGAAVAESGVYSIFDSPQLNAYGSTWIKDFGNPRNPKDIAWMSKFDVLNNTSADKTYPPTLVVADLSDNRVSAANGLTYAAMRQSMLNGETLLLVRGNEGHGQSSQNNLVNDKAAEDAFLWTRLNKNR
jgi:prolyl oligopeptidase